MVVGQMLKNNDVVETLRLRRDITALELDIFKIKAVLGTTRMGNVDTPKSKEIEARIEALDGLIKSIVGRHGSV